MQIPKHKLFDWITRLILVASLAYLSYILITFDSYGELWETLQNKEISDFWWLAAAILLLPFNLLIEAIKWKKLVQKLEKLPIIQAYKSVVTGISSGFVTPNKLGDIVGKLNFLQKENRKPALSLAAINSITQNIAIILTSLPLAVLFFLKEQTEIQHINYLILVNITLTLLIICLLYLPKLAKRIKKPYLQIYVKALQNLSFNELSRLTLWSVLRYVIFGFQLYLLLVFFDVDITASQALMGIATNYLLITITPSIAISEAFVRTSWAVFVLSRFSANIPGIALAGLSLWIINILIPVLIGNIILIRKNMK